MNKVREQHVDLVAEQCFQHLFQRLFDKSPAGISKDQFIRSKMRDNSQRIIAFLETGELTEREIREHFPFSDIAKVIFVPPY